MRHHHLPTVAVLAALILAACETDRGTVTNPVPATWSPSLDVMTYDCGTQTDIPATECDALIALYVGTGGENWWFQDDWLSGSPCDWYGVTCEAGHVSQLSLYSLGLTGTIPPALSDLTRLKWLALYDNQLTGPIPAELGHLGQLEALALSDNQLTGEIPASLGDLGQLEYLNLSGNQLTGPIPEELGALGRLTNLILEWNELTGPIPASLGNLHQLLFLGLAGNQLSGPIPATLGDLGLVDLDLAYNRLDGSIPGELGGLGRLERLHLYGNRLTGSIPAALGDLGHLKELDLSDNQLTGPIRAELGNLASLMKLLIQGNQLSGLVPLPVAVIGGVDESKRQLVYWDCAFVPPGNEGLYMPDTQRYRDADLDGNGLICGLPLSNAEALSASLLAAVDGLVADAALNGGQGNALTTKLEHAIEAADKRQYEVAANLADAFIRHVQALISGRVLTEVQAEALIERARSLIDIWSEP